MIDTKDNSELLEKCLGYISYAEDHPRYQDQRERAIINSEFEHGKQWTTEQYERYNDLGIEPVTINRCLSTIKALDGMFIENMQDITVIPRKGGTEAAARTISEIIKHSLDVGGYERASIQVFRNGNIQTVGYFEIGVDRKKTANGQLEFFAHSFFDVMIDPDCVDYDIDKMDIGAKFAIIRKFRDKEELAMLYGDDLGDYETSADNDDSYIDAVENKLTYYDDNEKKYRLPVYTVYWKETRKAVLVADKQTGQTKIITEKIGDVKRTAKKSNRFSVEDTTQVVLHKTIIINNKIVDTEESPFGAGFNIFPLVRYVPLFDTDYERGVLDDIVSLNREENLRRTQVSRLLNLTANGGWVINQNNDQKSYDELKRFGSIPGIIIDKSKFGGSVEKIVPNQISAGHMTLALQSSEDIKEITGLNSAVHGYDDGTKDEPGVVLSLKKQQGMSANEGMFKNFRITLETLGNKILAILDTLDIYTEDEIRAIITESQLIDAKMMQKAHDLIYKNIGTTLKPPQPVQPPPAGMFQALPPDRMPEVLETIKAGVAGNQMYAEQYPMLRQEFDKAIKEQAIRMLLSSLYNSEITQFGVKVITSPRSNTARLANFAMMMQIQQQFGVIPPDILIEYSDLPNKDEIISRIKGQMQQAQPVSAGGAA